MFHDRIYLECDTHEKNFGSRRFFPDGFSETRNGEKVMRHQLEMEASGRGWICRPEHTCPECLEKES